MVQYLDAIQLILLFEDTQTYGARCNEGCNVVLVEELFVVVNHLLG